MDRICNGCLNKKAIVDEEYGYCQYCCNYTKPKSIKEILDNVDKIGKLLEGKKKIIMKKETKNGK